MKTIKILRAAKKALIICLVLLAVACGKKKEWKVGDKVLAKSSGMWYEATILELADNGKYKIHYEGWSNTWDETLSTDRLANVGDHKPMPVPQGMFQNAVNALADSIKTNITMPTTKGKTAADNEVPAFDAKLTYQTGDAVWVKWNNKWYESSILEAKADNKYKIHYVGWADSFDEEVGTDRLRPFAAK